MVTRDLTVVYYGRDTSGRGLYMTRWMHDVIEAIKRHPLVSPFAWKIVVVQGAFMYKNGGGASSSDGFHNYGGCADFRTWNLTTSEITNFVHASRMLGFAAWRRDYSWQHGGMAPHAHGTLGSDSPLGYYAPISWSSYLNGGDGLAGTGGDYEWRPSPIVTYPPDSLMETDWLMTTAAETKIDNLTKITKQISQDLAQFRKGEYDRDLKEIERAKESKKLLVTALGGLADKLVHLENSVSDDANKALVKSVRDELLAALANDPTVDGVDNPAPPA